MTDARNGRQSVRVAFLTSSISTGPTGTGAISFAGTGTATSAFTGTGSGAIVFAGVGNTRVGIGAIVFDGVGTAVLLFPRGTSAIVFAGSGAASATGGTARGSGAIVFNGTATASTPTVAGGHITFNGRADADVTPNIAVYAPPEWSWYLLNADGSFIGALSAATARRLVFQLDGAATAQFSMPGLHPQTAKVVELATDVLVARNGRPLFRGRIGASSETHNADQDSVQFAAVDYRGMLKHRLLWVESQVIFYQVEQADIAWKLIADSQALPGGNWGITRGFGAPTGRLRDRTYTFGSSVGQMLDELGNVIDGFDWEIDANMAFNLFYPHRGTDRGLVLTYGRDVVAVTTTINPDTYANAVYFTGSMPITLPVEVAVSTFPPEIGRWDMQKSNPSLVRADTVAEQAAEALADASTLVPTLSITLRADVWNPYTLWLGDTIRAIVQTGRLDIDVHERVMEIDVSLDDDGVETVALALGTAPARLSDRFGDMEAAIAMLELQPTGLGGTPVGDYPGYPGDPFGGPGGDFPFGDFGGGGGGGGGIVEITSSDASITVTNPTGPVTDLSVAAGHITVLNPTGPIVDLVYSAPGGGINSYPNVEIVSYRDVDTYYTFSFRGGADGCEVVLDPVATGQPPTAGVGWVAQIVEPGFYTMSITITSLASLSLDPITGAPRYFGGAVVPYLPPFSGGGSWFLDPLSPPVTFTTGAFVTAGQIAAAPAPGLFLEWQLITTESFVGVDLHGLIDVTVSSTRS